MKGYIEEFKEYHDKRTRDPYVNSAYRRSGLNNKLKKKIISWRNIILNTPFRADLFNIVINEMNGLNTQFVNRPNQGLVVLAN